MKYVVVKEGVYHHGTWGPFDTLKGACDAARMLADTDGDCYHEWSVYYISLTQGLVGDKLGSVHKKCVPGTSCAKGGFCLGKKPNNLPE